MLGNYKILIKWVPWIICLGLVIALSVTQCSKQEIKFENHEEELKQAIAQKSKQVIDLANREQDLIRKLKVDSLKSSEALRASNKRIEVLEKKVASSRVAAQPDIDKSPTVTEFVEDTDSLISELHAAKDTCVADNARTWSTFNHILNTTEDKFSMQKELTDHERQLNKNLNKQLKRERNKKTGWKATAIGAIIIAIAKSLGAF